MQHRALKLGATPAQRNSMYVSHSVVVSLTSVLGTERSNKCWKDHYMQGGIVGGGVRVGELNPQFMSTDAHF